MSGPSRFQIDAADTVICLIDLQERLLAPMPDRDVLTDRVRILIEGTHALGIPVVWSEQYPRGLGATVEPVGSLLDPGLRAEKLHFSAWREPSFASVLKGTGRKTVVLPGIETHVCVWQTAVDLLTEGYRVFVPADCVGSRTDADKQVGLGLMRDAGAVITSMESIVFQLLVAFGGDASKAFSRLIR